jgi:hypothetical protein
VRDEELSPRLEASDGSRTRDSSSTVERCLSAPRKGGRLAAIFTDPDAPFTDEAHIYPGEGHKVGEKLMGCLKPDSPETTSDEEQDTGDANEVAATKSESSLPKVPALMNHTPPSIPLRHRQASAHTDDRRSSSMQQPTLPSLSSSHADAVPSNQTWETRAPGMSQVPFAGQIPLYAVSQHVQAPPAVALSKMNIYDANSIPTYTQVRYPTAGNAPNTFAGGSGSYLERNRNPDTRQSSHGGWQTVGSDDIHGPKAVYLMGSERGQQQRNGSNKLGRRPTNTNNKGNYPRFSNAPEYQYNNTSTGPRHADTNRPVFQAGVALTGPYHGSNSSMAPKLGQSSSTPNCVNEDRMCDIRTKFDPCSCHTCSVKDRTIYISNLKRGICLSDRGKELLAQRFGKHGLVESVQVNGKSSTSAHVR